MEKKRNWTRWYRHLKKEEKDFIKNKIIPLKMGMLKVIYKLMPLEDIPASVKGYHKLIYSIIERAIQDCHTEIITKRKSGYSAFNSAFIFLTDANGALSYWLDLSFWDDTDKIKEYCKQYAEKMKEYKEKLESLNQHKNIKRKYTIKIIRQKKLANA